MYVWTPVPATWGNDDLGFVESVFQRTRILLSPGSSFGDAGQGWVRISLVVDEARLGEVATRLRDSGLFHG
jgi:LL-diaminopimelate aminotransferase